VSKEFPSPADLALRLSSKENNFMFSKVLREVLFSMLTFFRFGVSTDSKSFPYCIAHDFEWNQSAGRELKLFTICFRARDTLIQFWSPEEATAEARQSCSWVFHSSNGLKV
jgi:hypothetical protein